MKIMLLLHIRNIEEVSRFSECVLYVREGLIFQVGSLKPNKLVLVFTGQVSFLIKQLAFERSLD
jgi:hypothetical protein